MPLGPSMESLASTWRSPSPDKGHFQALVAQVIRQPLSTQMLRAMLIIVVYSVELASIWPYTRHCRGLLSDAAAQAPIQVSDMLDRS